MSKEKKPARYKQGIVITKDNKLVRIHGNMTPTSYKLTNYILWAAIKQERLDNLTINGTEVVNMLGFDDNRLGKFLKDECKKVSETSVEIQSKDEPDEQWTFMNLIPWINYDHGVLKATINPKLAPYIRDLRGNFTPIEIETLNTCGTYPAMRLYEVCLSWKGAGEVEYSVAQWKALLGATKQSYNVFAQFRRRVFDPAVAAVNEKTNLHIEPSFEKEGRTVTYISVKIQEKNYEIIPQIGAPIVSEEQDKEKPVSKTLKTKEKLNSSQLRVLEDMMGMGLTKRTANKYLASYGEAYCKAQVDFVVEMSKKGRIKNTAGYLRRAMDGDFAGERERAREAERREHEWQRAKEQEKRELVEGGIFGERVATEGVESVGDIAKSIVRETKPSEPTDAPTMPPADEKAAGYWQAILGIAKSPLYGLSTLVVEHWLTPCVPVSVDGGTLSIVAPNDFAKRMIVSEYLATLKKAAAAMGISDVVCTAVS